MGRPASTHVFFDKDKNPTKEYWKIPSGASNKNEEWRVFTDRDQVRVLSEPEEAASEVKKFDFGQILWVAADKGEYVKVMESSGAAAVGWCHKRDLILWTEPLVDPKTSIEIKAFIVNTPKAIERLREGGSKESYKIYSSPYSNATTLQERAIYDVLFVYKYAPSEDGVKDGRYLVSLNARLSGSQKLWGSVEENRIKLWDTRLCLEPNFDPAAIAKRRTKDITGWRIS